MSDPYNILGISTDTDDACVHQAYLDAIKACPPEQDAQRFQAVRSAYEALRTRKDRLAHELFDHQPPTPREILDRAAPIGQPQRPPQALFQALLRNRG